MILSVIHNETSVGINVLWFSPPNKGHAGDANVVSIDRGFVKETAFVERPDVSQGAPLMAKTLGGLRAWLFPDNE